MCARRLRGAGRSTGPLFRCYRTPELPSSNDPFERRLPIMRVDSGPRGSTDLSHTLRAIVMTRHVRQILTALIFIAARMGAAASQQSAVEALAPFVALGFSILPALFDIGVYFWRFATVGPPPRRFPFVNESSSKSPLGVRENSIVRIVPSRARSSIRSSEGVK
jgi:hypothetical protein